jgi:hypothetical protein
MGMEIDFAEFVETWKYQKGYGSLTNLVSVVAVLKIHASILPPGTHCQKRSDAA